MSAHQNGGLEYIDSVLNNWMSKEIRQVHEADKEIREFKENRRSNQKILWITLIGNPQP